MGVLTGEKELRMQAGIERVENGESARAVADDLCLAHSTLSRRVKSHQFEVSATPTTRKLSEKAKEEVCNWIISEEAGGKAPNARQIRSFVAILLREQGLPDHIG
jgi:IS30 family transposase